MSNDLKKCAGMVLASLVGGEAFYIIKNYILNGMFAFSVKAALASAIGMAFSLVTIKLLTGHIEFSGRHRDWALILMACIMSGIEGGSSESVIITSVVLVLITSLLLALFRLLVAFGIDFSQDTSREATTGVSDDLRHPGIW